jgi:4-amino-4-deoxy-L-arabinose transferase-like glycosyltransferase
MRREALFIAALTLVGFALRLYKAEIPERPIGDEVYYVPEARNVLGLNEEGVPKLTRMGHPPLAIFIISLGMQVLGDNSLGWRIGSIIAGTLAIPLFYLLARRIFHGRKESIYSVPLSSFLFAFETMQFYFSRVARLDIFMLVFLLAGAYFLLDEKPRRKLLSAAFFALAFLAKEAAAIVILPLLIYGALVEIERPKGKKKGKGIQIRFNWRLFLQLTSLTGVVTLVVWYVIEWVLLTPTKANIIERVLAMMTALAISNPGAVGRSEIWQWFFNYPLTKAAGAYPGVNIEFPRLVMGPLVTPGLKYAYFIQVSWTVLIFMLPVMIWMIYLSRRDRVARFTAFFWLGGLLGWIVVNSVYRALIYLFYILTILPPVILAISLFVGGKLYTEQKTRQVKWTAITLLYAALHLVNFFLLYPVAIS